MIYVLQDQGNGHIKIGYSSKSPTTLTRPSDLQTGTSGRLVVLFTLPGERDVEGEYLARFAEHRVIGGGREWFRPVGSVLQFIRDHLPEGPPPLPEKKKDRPDFERLAALEPRLRSLLKTAESYATEAALKSDFCANAAWYGYGGYPGIKESLCQLVGWERKSEPKELRTTVAYDVAYQTIFNALPDCGKDCACFRMLGACLEACDE